MRAKTTSLLFFLLAFCLILAPTAMAATLTVTTNANVYAPGETILVSGSALANTDVTVQLLNPNGQLVDIDYVTSGADGSYSLSFKIPSTIPTGQWIYGTYIVKAFSGAQTATKTITIQLRIAVTGKVVDSAGAAISEATVTVGTSTATTATDGTFNVSLVAEGTYTIKVSKTGYYSYTGTVTAAIGTTNVGTITLTSYEDKIKELEKQVSDLNKAIDDLKNTVNSLNSKVSELSALASMVNDLKSRVDSLSSSLQSANNEISSLKATVQQLQTTVAIATDLKSSVEALQSTVNSLKSSVDALQATTAQLPVLYALALVGIIIAVIAVILVYRKIAA
jgi:peptidoglycan hydrolase CwlO-like protein